MALTSDQFLERISHKKIYYFVSHHIKNSPEPHYFVCSGFDSENVMILSCFTTQLEKKMAYVQSRDLDYSTLVFVDPTTENGLTQKCCVNCNDIYLHTKEEFKSMYESGILKLKGELEDNYYAQVCIGIKNSDLVDEEKKVKIIEIDC